MIEIEKQDEASDDGPWVTLKAANLRLFANGEVTVDDLEIHGDPRSIVTVMGGLMRDEPAPVLAMEEPDGETQVWTLDGTEVARATHDEQGWEGMAAVGSALLAAAGAAGWTVRK